MAKRLRYILVLVCLLPLVCLHASAESSATSVNTRVDVDAYGNCSVVATINVHMEIADEALSFPVPANAANITMNGNNVQTAKSGNSIYVYLTRETLGMVGDYSMTVRYTVPKTVGPNENRQLILQLPLLGGFAYPINDYSFLITLPGVNENLPYFYSTYRQTGIESDLEYTVNGNMITGNVKGNLNDHEALSMTLMVPQEMFPTISTYQRTGNPEVVPMVWILVGAAVYWLLFLRTWFPHADDSATPPEGVTAGEVGCRLTLAGGDLTMMTLTWGYLGYVTLQIDSRGRLLLHKRMDMGNERSLFEVRVFNSLFARGNSLDATGKYYTKVSRDTFAMVPGEKTAFRASSGNIRLFRLVCCVSHIFCGICMAMNLSNIFALQIVLAAALGVLAAVTAWLMQDIAYRNHLRGKTRVYIGLIAAAIWFAIGFAAGALPIAAGSVAAQIAAGYLAAYGGRRSAMNRQECNQILGLRRYLKRIPQEDIQRNCALDPDYYFRMAPYALALGVMKPFSARFKGRKIGPCPYLLLRDQDKRTAEEWGYILSKITDRMDARFRRMEMEKWTFIKIR